MDSMAHAWKAHSTSFQPSPLLSEHSYLQYLHGKENAVSMWAVLTENFSYVKILGSQQKRGFSQSPE